MRGWGVGMRNKWLTGCIHTHTGYTHIHTYDQIVKSDTSTYIHTHYYKQQRHTMIYIEVMGRVESVIQDNWEPMS